MNNSFDRKSYINNYTDLRNAYFATQSKAIMHWKNMVKKKKELIKI